MLCKRWTSQDHFLPTCACQVLSENGHMKETGWERQVEVTGRPED